ncbi:MAG TPA: hypothetical protein VH593_33740 [Ktedonobacteraceae bacterium]|jgi:hypothetical protein
MSLPTRATGGETRGRKEAWLPTGSARKRKRSGRFRTRQQPWRHLGSSKQIEKEVRRYCICVLLADLLSSRFTEMSKLPKRNRRASIHLSPLASVPSGMLLAGSISSIPPIAHHVTPPVPPLKIPRSAWPTIVQRAAQGESLRSIARSLNTSYEAVRRVLLAARQEMLGDPDEPLSLSDEDVG